MSIIPDFEGVSKLGNKYLINQTIAKCSDFSMKFSVMKPIHPYQVGKYTQHYVLMDLFYDSFL